MTISVRNRSDAALAFPLVSAAIVAVGASLPWVRPNPSLAGQGDAVPDILLPQMNAGLEPYGFVILAVAAVAVACAYAALRVDRRAAVGTAVAGGAVAVVPIRYLLSRSLVGIDGTFVPTLGWYATVFGGLALALVGIVCLTAASTRSA